MFSLLRSEKFVLKIIYVGVCLLNRGFAIGVICSEQSFQIPHTATSFNRRYPLWHNGHKQAWAGAAAGTRGCRSHDAENCRPDCLRAEPTAANAMPVPDHVGLYHPENRWNGVPYRWPGAEHRRVSEGDGALGCYSDIARKLISRASRRLGKVSWCLLARRCYLFKRREGMQISVSAGDHYRLASWIFLNSDFGRLHVDMAFWTLHIVASARSDSKIGSLVVIGVCNKSLRGMCNATSDSCLIHF